MNLDIKLQPKQYQLLETIENWPGRTIGLGGGRGAAKSGGIDRVALSVSVTQPEIVSCIVMRTYEQLRKYHIDPMMRAFPDLKEYYLKSDKKVRIPVGSGKFSELDFGYAENYDAVEEFFRSGNYKYIFVDQAEQFLEHELREMRKACRWPGGGAKIVLSHNMGGVGIQTLRKWFYLREFGKFEDPESYTFIKVNPWDNVEWVKDSLAEDGYTVADYYRWSDEQRMEYAATHGEYTKELASDDEALRNRDWLGSWDSLEGAYFGNVFDLEATRVSPNLVEHLRKPWATHWLSQDWGKSHYNASYWHYRVALSPSEVDKYFGWKRQTPLNVIVTYREMIVSELTSVDVARKLIDATPLQERERLKAYYLSPECVTDDPNSVGSQQSKELRGMGMPGASKADNDRLGGWSLMAKLLKAAKQKGVDEKGQEHADIWLISSECSKLLETIPILMRDPKNLDDVLKTDKSYAQMEMDIADAVRYGLKTMLSPRKKTEEDKHNEAMQVATPAQRMLLQFRHEQKKQASRQMIMPPSWKRNL